MKKTRHCINFTHENISFELLRLSDDKYWNIRQHSLPIREDSSFFIRLSLSERYNPDRLTLPKAFLAMQGLFGDSSDDFDDWKGSFYFPLLLTLKKSQESFLYVFKVYDHRGSLNMGFYRVLDKGNYDHDINCYHEPFELEFSREEINQFICFFYGYLIGFFETIDQASLSPFLKRIDSNNILYGYRQEGFFEEQFESEEDYQQAIASFEEVYSNYKH